MTDVLQQVTQVVDNSKDFFTKLKDLIAAKEAQIQALVAKVSAYESQIFNLQNINKELEAVVSSISEKIKEMENVIQTDIITPVENTVTNTVEEVKNMVDNTVNTVVTDTTDVVDTAVKDAEIVKTDVVTNVENVITQAENVIKNVIEVPGEILSSIVHPVQPKPTITH